MPESAIFQLKVENHFISMNDFVIEAKKLSKSYAGNQVLRDVDFHVRAGEIHCVVGENGAGKSTLIKLLTGAVSHSAGDIFVHGIRVSRMDPWHSSSLGIQAIYQENILAFPMSVAENIYTGHERCFAFGFYSKKEAVNRARALMDEYNIQLDPETLVSELSSAQRQYVKILKAMALESKVLIMDEPTTMFSSKDSERLLDTVLRIKEKGVAVIYISHQLQEVMRIADRVTVLRDGVKVSEYDNADKDLDLRLITNDMVGRPVQSFYQKAPHAIGDVAVKVRKLRLKPGDPELSFDVRRGEILGVAGMVGSGRTEMARALFGADRKHGGVISIDGKTVHTNTPRQAIKSNLAFISEDRQRQGLALNMSVLENLLQVKMNKAPCYWFSPAREAQQAAPVYERVNIRGCGMETAVRQLSGGNQQKVVLGKWLLVDSRFIILDEPTRGIDVNAKSEIYGFITELAKAGKSILMISSDMPELIALCDRILVMRAGRITGEIPKDSISQQEIIRKALEVEA